MSTITIRSHLPRPLGLPYPPTPKEGTIFEIKHILPGDNVPLDEAVVKAYAEHPAVRPYLLAGDLGGLEIVAVDGEPVSSLGGHAAALAAIFEGTKPEELALLVQQEQKRVLDEARALEELISNADKPQTIEQERIA